MKDIDASPKKRQIDDTNPTISVVVPMFNESENISHFYNRILEVFTLLKESWEIVCINDGSTDTTLCQLICLHESDRRVKVINLSRNFGKEIALTAGLRFAKGIAVIPIDADLQDPPELILTLVEKWREGYDVVNATRKTRQGESWIKRGTATLFYKCLAALSDIQIPRNTGDFRLLSRPAIDALNKMPENNRFMKGLFAWVGFSQVTVYYDRHPRYAGSTKWNYWRLWNLAIEGITSFSTVPLKISSYLGVGLSFFSFVYAGFLILKTLLFGVDAPGYASLMVVMLFIGGIQLIILGVIGEYLGRIFNEAKRRPLYIIRDSYGVDEI